MDLFDLLLDDDAPCGGGGGRGVWLWEEFMVVLRSGNEDISESKKLSSFIDVSGRG